MSAPDDNPIARAAYDSFAARYAARVDTKPHNALYERPATLSLLPDVAGKTVLDAGCGPGVYAEWLLDRGAQVIAVDVSAAMIALAQERVGSRAGVTLRQADLARPLDFLVEASVDLVLSALALDYVRDWAPVFREFHRVLQPGGAFVFSADHPAYTLLADTADNYFEIELVVETWRGFGKPVQVPRYRRPFGAVIAPLLDAGFALERVLEPRPVPAFAEAEPEDYARLLRRPGFICLRARKP